MTFIERDLIKKAGADAGWSIAKSETAAVVQGCFAHSQQAFIKCLERETFRILRDVDSLSTANTAPNV